MHAWLAGIVNKHTCCRALALPVLSRTVTDVHVTPLGLLLALTAVLASGLQQVMCGALQRKHRVSSHQLLSNTAHVQVCVCMCVCVCVSCRCSSMRGHAVLQALHDAAGAPCAPCCRRARCCWQLARLWTSSCAAAGC
jgi:hypothetical protein